MAAPLAVPSEVGLVVELVSSDGFIVAHSLQTCILSAVVLVVAAVPLAVSSEAGLVVLAELVTSDGFIVARSL